MAEYWGAGKPTGKKVNPSQKPLILVGKGITYDTGGLNVKPSGYMHDMHLDMSGGSAVLGAIFTVAKLGLKKNVVALVPTAENAVSETAMRAGDIVTAMNGKTIEVLHTDAEGRMVLADALTYSERYNPKAILDVATLTGLL
ncbi:MAG: M17 family metallopeptidase [Candidatus Paceibacterota bacterium]